MSQENVEIVRRLYAGRERGDLRTVDFFDVIDLGEDRVLVLSRQTARGKTSGLPFEHELGDLFTLSDGKVLRYASYWDRADTFKAAGLAE